MVTAELRREDERMRRCIGKRKWGGSIKSIGQKGGGEPGRNVGRGREEERGVASVEGSTGCKRKRRRAHGRSGPRRSHGAREVVTELNIKQKKKNNNKNVAAH